MKKLSAFTDIIGLWPTAADFGRAIGVSDVHARAMKRRNSIPSKYWSALVDEARQRGFNHVTHEALAEIDAAQDGAGSNEHG